MSSSAYHQELPASVEEVGRAALVLDASNNRLQALPASVARLSSLTRLVVPHNRLTVLPPQLTALTNLKVCLRALFCCCAHHTRLFGRLYCADILSMAPESPRLCCSSARDSDPVPVGPYPLCMLLSHNVRALLSVLLGVHVRTCASASLFGRLAL